MTPQNIVAVVIAVLSIALGAWFGRSLEQGKTAAVEIALAEARSEWEKERRAAAEQYAAALEEANNRAAREQKRAITIEKSYEETRKKNAEAIAAVSASADRLRNELRAAETRLNNASAAASAQVGTAALNVAGQCAVEYQRLGSELAGCANELTRVHGLWPK